MAVMENQARMEVAAGAEEELKALVAWPIFQEIKELRQDLRADRERTDGKIDGLRLEMTDKIETLRKEVKGDIADLRTELKGDIADLRTELKGEFADLRKEMRNDFRWLMGTMIVIIVPITVVMLRLAFK